MLMTVIALLFWPLLQGQAQYIELSKYWKPAGAIETSLPHLMAAVTCPAPGAEGGWLIAADSSGQMEEMRFAGGQWNRVRKFSVGDRLVTLCSGASYSDLRFRLYAGTPDGRVLEISRGASVWYKREILRLSEPIKRILVTEALPGAAKSQFLILDANGAITHLFAIEHQGDKNAVAGATWEHVTLPAIPGGAADICAGEQGPRLWAAATTPKGDVWRFGQDSLGGWTGGVWAKMAAGTKSLAAASDPSMRDIALFYSGADGIFRYLFFKHTGDEQSRVPVAAGVSHLIGSGSERRFNEFFGLSGNEFCMFDYSFEDKAWEKVPFGTIDAPVVATTFGNGRAQQLSQMFVACANGKIYEFLRDQK